MPPALRTSAARHGFSLLELLVVVVILGIISSAVVPVYIAAMGAIRLRSAQNELVSTLRFVQERAVSDSREYRLYLDDERQSFWVARHVGWEGEDKVFQFVEEAYGREQFFPTWLELERPRARKDRDVDAYFIACFPNGASDRAEIKLTNTRTRRTALEIETEGVLGRIRVERR